MRLTWRDGVAALFAVVVGLITVAVTREWGWPLLGSYRAGIVALALVGVPMCLIGGYAFWDSPAFRHPRLILKDPFLTAAAALGLVAVAVLVVGVDHRDPGALCRPGRGHGGLWILTTTHHAVEQRPGIDIPGTVGGVS